MSHNFITNSAENATLKKRSSVKFALFLFRYHNKITRWKWLKPSSRFNYCKGKCRLIPRLFFHLYTNRLQLDDTQLIKKLDKNVHRVYLKPFVTKIGFVAKTVVIVVVAFAQHQKVEWQEVARGIFNLEILVTKFVCKPIDYRTVKRSHEIMNGQ